MNELERAIAVIAKHGYLSVIQKLLAYGGHQLMNELDPESKPAPEPPKAPEAPKA